MCLKTSTKCKLKRALSLSPAFYSAGDRLKRLWLIVVTRQIHSLSCLISCLDSLHESANTNSLVLLLQFLSHIICIAVSAHVALSTSCCLCVVKMVYTFFLFSFSFFFAHLHPALCGLKYCAPLATVTVVSSRYLSLFTPYVRWYCLTFSINTKHSNLKSCNFI